MSEARSEILSRIRAALGSNGGRVATPPARSLGSGTSTLKPAIASNVRAAFEEKARANLMVLHSIAELSDVPATVAAIARSSNIGNDVSIAPALLSLNWPVTMTVRSAKARVSEKVAVTRASAGIAETGTVVMCSGETAPASLNFAPEVSIIVLEARDIEAYLEDGLKAAHAKSDLLPRVISLVSGPSRTADVAGIVVRPAHGPKQVHLILVG